MDKKLKTEIVEEVVESMKEVFMPEFEKMHDRLTTVEKKVNGLQEDMSDVKDTLGRIERRMNSQEDRLDRHGKMLEKHDKQILALQKS